MFSLIDVGFVCEDREDSPLELLVGGCPAFPNKNAEDFPLTVRGRTERKVFFSIEQTFLDEELEQWAVTYQKNGEQFCDVARKIEPDQMKMYFDAECDQGFAEMKLYIHSKTYDETWMPEIPGSCPNSFAPGGTSVCEYSFAFACVCDKTPEPTEEPTSGKEVENESENESEGESETTASPTGAVGITTDEPTATPTSAPTMCEDRQDSGKPDIRSRICVP